MIARLTTCAAAFSGLILSLAGCGTGLPRHLNEPTRSVLARDIATLNGSAQIPYETQERGGLAVGYNLQFEPGGKDFSGYRLTLVLRNMGPSKRTVSPEVMLQDSTGFMVEPYAYGAFMARAQTLSVTPIPPRPVRQAQPSGGQAVTNGSVTNQRTGAQVGYQQTTTYTPAVQAGFGQAFVEGMADGAVSFAQNQRQLGDTAARWASAYWIKSVYELPPGAASGGALVFGSAAAGPFPMKVTVTVDGERFEFLTIDPPKK